MSSSRLSCGPCGNRNQHIEAAVWCPTCAEGLCKVCLEHHKYSRASKSHDVIEAKKYQSFPSFIFKIKQDCTKHDKALEVYCPNHLVPCCETCVSTDHATCTGIKSLISVSRNVRSSALCKDLEKNLKIVLNDLDNLKRNRNENLKSFPTQKAVFKSELDQQRSRFFKRFQQLEQALLNDFDKTSREESKKIERAIQKINQKKNDVQKIQTRFEAAQTQISDVQLFLGLHDLDSQLLQEKEDIRSLLDDESMNEIKIILRRTNTDISSVGCIAVNQETCKSMLSEIMETDAQFAAIKPTISHHLTVVSVKEMKIIEGPVISALLKIGNDRVILADCSSHKGLLLIERDVCKELTIPGKPWALAILNRDIFAVSYPEQRSIKLINQKSLSVLKTLTLQEKVTGLACMDGIIVAGVQHVQGNNICFVDTDGYTVDTLSVKVNVDYIHATSGKIYCSNTDTNTIYCFDRKGKIIWSFLSHKIRKPQGICSDEAGNVFVAGYKSDNIVVIIPPFDNEKVITLGIHNARAICCTNGILYVSNESGDIAPVLRIQYK